MTARLPIVFLLPVVVATACADGPEAALAPDLSATTVTADASILAGAPTTVVVDQPLFHPCATEVVHVIGRIQLEAVARSADPDRYEVMTMIQATGLTGQSESGRLDYRFTGAATARSNVHHRERVVTSADFRSIVIRTPGAAIHRASVSPGLRVTLSFPVPANGQLDGVTVDAVSFDQSCHR